MSTFLWIEKLKKKCQQVNLQTVERLDDRERRTGMDGEGSSRDIIFYFLWMDRGIDLKLETLGAPGEIKNQYSPNTGSNIVTLLEKQWVLHLNYPLSYRVPVRERYGSTLLPATREQHDQNCAQGH